eukprot:709964-Rhodomonas_salina.1
MTASCQCGNSVTMAVRRAIARLVCSASTETTSTARAFSRLTVLKAGNAHHATLPAPPPSANLSYGTTARNKQAAAARISSRAIPGT